MNNTRKFGARLLTVLMVVAIFVSGFFLGTQQSVSSAQGPFAIGEVDEAFEPFWEAYSTIQTRFVDTDQLSVTDLVDGAIRGMVDTLDDQNSIYYTPDEYTSLNQNLSGDMEGIGVVITTNEDTEEIEVVTVLAGAPAEDAGVLPGDVFWEVNGESVLGLTTNELAERVRGPAGTTVTIVFKRGEEFVEFDIQRDSFEVPNVTTEVLEDDIAYVKLEQFNQLAARQLREALFDLDVNEREGLVFDLRGNPGGLLTSAIDVGSIFVDEGTLVYEAFGDGREESFEVNGRSFDFDVPVVVLVDEGSASASELVSGALKDFEAATLIGEVTFGKGTVQQIHPLSNGGGLRLTVARYLLPSREWVHDVGVTPDFIIEYDPAVDGTEVDPQLQAAINFILTGDIE